MGLGTLRSLPPCLYNYLKKVHITGFNGLKGSLEFLVHIVENAPALKVLTTDPRKKLGLCHCNDSYFLASRASDRRELEGKLGALGRRHPVCAPMSTKEKYIYEVD